MKQKKVAMLFLGNLHFSLGVPKSPLTTYFIDKLILSSSGFDIFNKIQ